MKNSTNIYNLKKADFVCTCIILMVGFLAVVSNFIGASFSAALTLSLPVLAAVIVVIVIYFIPFDSKIKGIIYSIIIFAASLFSLMQDPTDQTVQYSIAASIVILSLYFSKELLIIYATIINLSFITVFLTNNILLFGKTRPASYLISTLFMIDGIFLVLYFVNKWGSEMIAEAASKEKEVNKLLERLQSTLKKVEEASSVLEKSISTIDLNMSSIVESSRETALAMNEIAVGTEQQAESITNINFNMTKAIEEVNKTKQVSEKISVNSDLISTNVSSSSEKINFMSSQMQTINHAVSAALTTVNVLRSNIAEINKFLKGITQISEQTNLLSLNAAIESARAGEHGKGFSVVAEQVGKLAEQSSETVKSIQSITGTISQNSAAAVEKVSQGENAVIYGNSILVEVSDYFRDVEYAINETFKLLETENTMISNILEQFMQVQERIENIAAISEQHSASNQEILATIENENNDIIAINNSIKEIKQLSSVLNEMLQG